MITNERSERNALWQLISRKVLKIGKWHFYLILIQVFNFGFSNSQSIPLIAWKRYPEKIHPKKSLWIPLSANLFRLESSILMRAMQATNRNNVETEKRRYIFFLGGGDFFRGDFVGVIFTYNPWKHHAFRHCSDFSFFQKFCIIIFDWHGNFKFW